MGVQSKSTLKKLKNTHVGKIIKILAHEKACSRAEIMEKTGLSKMAVSKIVTELMEKGYVIETKNKERRGIGITGPKPTLLSLKENKLLAIGVYISRESVRVALLDLTFHIIHEYHKSFHSKDTKQDIQNIMLGLINELLDDYEDRIPYILGVGVVSPTIYINHRGVMYKTEDLGESYNLVVRDSKTNRSISFTTYMGNDMQGAGLAEALFGVAKTKKDFLYVGIGENISGSYIIGNTVDGECRGIMSNIGHICVNYNGELCKCGNRGCYELYANIPLLVQKSKCLTYEDFLNKLNRRDPLAIRSIEDFIHVSESAFTSLINVLTPECIIVGENASYMDKWTLKHIESLMNVHCIQQPGRFVKLYASSLKDDASIWGAGAIVFQHLFHSDILIT